MDVIRNVGNGDGWTRETEGQFKGAMEALTLQEDAMGRKRKKRNGCESLLASAGMKG